MSVSEAELIDFGTYLGIEIPGEEHLLWIAREALLAPLPAQWVEHVTASGDVYYYNKEKDESSRKHPLESHFRQRIKEARAQRKDETVTALRTDKEAFKSERPSDSQIGAIRQFESATIHDEESPAVEGSVTVLEIEEMAKYLGVDLGQEPALLIWIYRAVIAPVPDPWEEHFDSVSLTFNL